MGVFTETARLLISHHFLLFFDESGKRLLLENEHFKKGGSIFPGKPQICQSCWLRSFDVNVSLTRISKPILHRFQFFLSFFKVSARKQKFRGTHILSVLLPFTVFKELYWIIFMFIPEICLINTHTHSRFKQLSLFLFV